VSLANYGSQQCEFPNSDGQYLAHGGGGDDDLRKRWLLNQFNENTVAAAKLEKPGA
jgi:hypothetical protein